MKRAESHQEAKRAEKREPKIIKQRLLRQAFWQVHSPPPKRNDRPHYELEIPNEMYQFDLLYMPTDKLYKNEYKYILSGIEVARPLRTKQV